MAETETAPPLQIQLLGGFQLLWQGEPIKAFANTRLQRLLAYLILNQDTPQPRHTLAHLFWPDSSDSQARTNLRNALHLLRTHLPQVEEYLRSDKNSVKWRSNAPAHVDVLAFDAHLQSGLAATAVDAAQHAYTTAIAYYAGELLPDCYEEWILPLRETWQSRYEQALQLLAQLLERQRDYPAAIDFAQKLLQLDPLQENNYAQLMTLQAASGDRAAALRTYHNCQTKLIDELGVEPGPATQAIYERLLNLDAEDLPATTRPRNAPLIGRDAAWQSLQSTWQRVAEADAEQPGQALMLITGEAGIGKSRLATEWSTLLARQGITTAVAHCYSAGGRLAFAPLQAWLRTPQIQQHFDQLPPHHQQALLTTLA